MLKNFLSLFIIFLLLMNFTSFAEASLNRPLVRIETVSTDPDPVTAGEEFIIKLSLKNEGNQSARSVLLTLLSLEGKETLDGFSPMETDNSLYLSRLDAGKSKDKEIKMRVAGDLAPGVYNMIFALEYLNYRGTRYESNHIAGIVVAHEGRLAFYNIDLPHEIEPGEILNLQGEIANAGTSSVSNVILTISGDFDFTPAEYFFGRFESGDMDFFNAEGIATGEGLSSVKLEVSYFDSMNRLSSMEMEKKIDIITPESGAANSMENKEGGLWASLRRLFMRILGLGGSDV